MLEGMGPFPELPVASPIEARCRRCGALFDLKELTEARTGRCPQCDRLLSPDWTSELLEKAKVADASLGALVKALRRLNGLPGNLRLLPHSVVRNLFEEIGWEETLAAEPGALEDEIRLVRHELQLWQRLTPADHNRRDVSRLARRLRRLANRLYQADHLSPASSGGGESA